MRIAFASLYAIKIFSFFLKPGFFSVLPSWGKSQKNPVSVFLFL